MLVALALAGCQGESVGAGGTGAGGSNGTGGSGGTGGMGGATGLQITSASRDGSRISITLSEEVFGIWATWCPYQHARLLKRVGEAWVGLTDDRPACSQPYYLDGTYQENGCNLGCDGGDSCYPISELTINTVEYILEPSPAGGGGAGGAGGASNVPSVVSRVAEGPYMLDLAYKTACASEKTLTLQLPVNVE